MKFTMKRYIDIVNWAADRYGMDSNKTVSIEFAAWTKYLNSI